MAMLQDGHWADEIHDVHAVPMVFRIVTFKSHVHVMKNAV